MPKGSGSGGGGTAHIDVYARVRPSKKPSRHLEIDYAEHAIAMKLERKREEAVVNNQRENYSFAFSRVLDMSTTQDTVFETVARPVVDSVLDGYNGTIFAYGQTGSGKTFTITGGAERYVDRGIIPRALSYIFGRLAEQRSEYTYGRRRAILSAARNSRRNSLTACPSPQVRGADLVPRDLPRGGVRPARPVARDEGAGGPAEGDDAGRRGRPSRDPASHAPHSHIRR